ncbi:subtilisin-like protein [Massarina eburnea CBS 473.64]|uniref:Subtilisin-like protein n=1 Tax=Massarina eburnea CBS 473.64 TaxID=1395130 RepID=A0A6A6RQP1_9PLEO|nr:subtilisin-like protein [Massarina eburnea CBS 473.64]
MLDKDEHPDALKVLQLIGRNLDDDGIFAIHDNAAWTVIQMNATEECINELDGMAEVSLVEKEATVKSFVTQQTTAPWGLQRISNEAGASGDAQAQAFTYSFEDESLGAGVDIYVVDTGVRVSHSVFGGRAVEGFSFTDTAADGDGHGTHVAGSSAGARFGVAQKANIIAVKVLGDDGSGSSSNTIAGMNWVINNHNKRKTQDGFIGSIMSMSWGLQAIAQTVDQAIDGAIGEGIHVSVAAGNDGADACTISPSHLGGSNSAVVTVGSVNIKNAVSSFSNIGSCVDIYAPGEQILSSWNTGDAVINFLSGTSMATPQNSGVMAYLMEQDASLRTDPAALKAKLLSLARKNVITGSLGGSANLLLSNGVDGSVSNYSIKRTTPEDRRTVTGSPATWAKNLVNNLGQRWVVESTDSPVRY